MFKRYCSIPGTKKPPCPLQGLGFVVRLMSPLVAPSRSLVSTRSWNSLVRFWYSAAVVTTTCNYIIWFVFFVPDFHTQGVCGPAKCFMEEFNIIFLYRRVWTQEQAWGLEGEVHSGQDPQSCQRAAHFGRKRLQTSVWRYAIWMNKSFKWPMI